MKNSTKLNKNFRLTNALETFNTATKEERIKKEKSFDQLIKNTPILSPAKLKEETDNLYAEKVAKENSILAAAESGILKSERLKKKAGALKAKKEREAAKTSTPAETEN